MRRAIVVIVVISIGFATVQHTLPDPYNEYFSTISFIMAIIAIVLTIEMFDTFKNEKQFKKKFGVPALLQSVEELEQSTLRLIKLLRTEPYNVCNIQIGNILQQLYHTRSGLLQYAIGDNSVEVLGDVISSIGSPMFALTEKDSTDETKIGKLVVKLHVAIESLQTVHNSIKAQKRA